jgi:hypothetical protein
MINLYKIYAAIITFFYLGFSFLNNSFNTTTWENRGFCFFLVSVFGLMATVVFGVGNVSKDLKSTKSK